MKIKKISKNIPLFLLLSVVMYLAIALSLTVYVFGKYYFINIKDIKHTNSTSYSFPFYEPQSGRHVYANSKIKKEYDVYINVFGSRNLFEVSKDDKNLIILLGDSFFFGDGLDDDKTVTYFLNQIDDKRKYVNLAARGYNIIDSVERYLLKKPEINPPVLIIFQILLCNDIYTSYYTCGKTMADVLKQDYKYILYPFNKVFAESDLFICFERNIEKKIYNDLSEERFVKYISNPLNRLFEEISKYDTRLMIIIYDTPPNLKVYEQKIRHFCMEKDIYFYTIEDLVENSYIEQYRLPDGHPSSDLNRVAAAAINNKMKELGLI